MAELSREEISSQGYEIVREWDVTGTSGTQRFAEVMPPGGLTGQSRVIVIKSPQPAELGQVVGGFVSPQEERSPSPEMEPLLQKQQEARERAQTTGTVEYGFRGQVAPPEERFEEVTTREVTPTFVPPIGEEGPPKPISYFRAPGFAPMPMYEDKRAKQPTFEKAPSYFTRVKGKLKEIGERPPSLFGALSQPKETFIVKPGVELIKKGEKKLGQFLVSTGIIDLKAIESEKLKLGQEMMGYQKRLKDPSVGPFKKKLTRLQIKLGEASEYVLGAESAFAGKLAQEPIGVPLKITAAFYGGKAFTWLGGTSKVSKFLSTKSALTQTVLKTAPIAAYAGIKGFQIAAEPMRFKRGEIIGKAFAEEVLPIAAFGAGMSTTLKVKKPPKIVKPKPEIKRYKFKKTYRTRDVLAAERRVQIDRLLEKPGTQKYKATLYKDATKLPKKFKATTRIPSRDLSPKRIRSDIRAYRQITGKTLTSEEYAKIIRRELTTPFSKKTITKIDDFVPEKVKPFKRFTVTRTKVPKVKEFRSFTITKKGDEFFTSGYQYGKPKPPPPKPPKVKKVPKVKEPEVFKVVTRDGQVMFQKPKPKVKPPKAVQAYDERLYQRTVPTDQEFMTLRTFRKPKPKVVPEDEAFKRLKTVFAQPPEREALYPIATFELGLKKATAPKLKDITITETRIIEREKTKGKLRTTIGEFQIFPAKAKQIPKIKTKQRLGLKPRAVQIPAAAQAPALPSPTIPTVPSPAVTIPRPKARRPARRSVIPEEYFPTRKPTTPIPFFPLKGVPYPKTTLLPSTPRKFRYTPTLVGIALGKTIAKAPKGMLTGLEIRAPVKLKKRKKRRWLQLPS